MKQFLTTFAGVVAGLALFFIGAPLLLALAVLGATRPAATPARTVLSLDLRQPLADQDAQNALAFLSGRPLSVLSVVRGLQQAAADPAVKGLLVRLPEGGISPAAADELRAAVHGFHAAGKPVIAHSQGIYPSGQPVATYMLGAASGDGFWMQPQSSLQAVGAAVEDLFFKRAFDKYGVQADYQQRYEYKNAVDPYLHDDYTPAHREAELGWLGSVYATETAQAAADRRLDPAVLRRALESGPHLAEAARSLGLIDRVGQVAEAEAALKARAGDGAQLLDFADYHGPKAARAGGDAVAVIGAEGAITTGVSRGAAFGAASGVKSDDVARAFQAAAADRSVKAIVFRVSSPGGSDTASEEILAALREAQATGKPVVVSMGTYAASGGYWISSGAREIVADPTTLTGSIGVFGGKFVLGPALARFGVDTRDLSVGGPYADAFGTDKPFTPEQRAAFAGWMDQIYAGFVDRVAQGRHLAPERVRQIARGRVWTGAQARELGLVDKLGGFPVAVTEAERLAHLPTNGATPLKHFTGKTNLFGDVGAGFATAGTALKTAALLVEATRGVQGRAVLGAVDRAQLASEGQGAVLAAVPTF